MRRAAQFGRRQSPNASSEQQSEAEEKKADPKPRSYDKQWAPVQQRKASQRKQEELSSGAARRLKEKAVTAQHRAAEETVRQEEQEEEEMEVSGDGTFSKVRAGGLKGKTGRPARPALHHRQQAVQEEEEDEGLVVESAASNAERDIAGVDDDDYIVREVEDEAAEAGLLREMRRAEEQRLSSDTAEEQQQNVSSRQPARSAAKHRSPSHSPSITAGSTAAPATRSSPAVKAKQKSAVSPAIAAAALSPPPPPPPAPSAASLPVPPALSGPPLLFQHRKFAFLQPPVVTEQLLSLSSQTGIPILAAAADSSSSSSPSCSDSDFVLAFTPDLHHLCLRYADSLENRRKQRATALPLTAYWQQTVKRVERLPLVRALGWGRSAQVAQDKTEAVTEEGDHELNERSQGEQKQEEHDAVSASRAAAGAWFDQPLRGLTVFDATAGLGRDAWFAVYAGATVYACERHPALFALLSHYRAQHDHRKLQPRMQRLRLLHADAAAVLSASPLPVPQPDVVYMDLCSAELPHWKDFRHSQRRSLLRLLSVAPAADGEKDRRQREEELQTQERQLLELARKAAKHCVVVKRLATRKDGEEERGQEKSAEEEERGLVRRYRSDDFDYLVFKASGGDEKDVAAMDAAVQEAEDRRDS